jgi:hypothetical protein
MAGAADWAEEGETEMSTAAGYFFFFITPFQTGLGAFLQFVLKMSIACPDIRASMFPGRFER